MPRFVYQNTNRMIAKLKLPESALIIIEELYILHNLTDDLIHYILYIIPLYLQITTICGPILLAFNFWHGKIGAMEYRRDYRLYRRARGAVARS